MVSIIRDSDSPMRWLLRSETGVIVGELHTHEGHFVLSWGPALSATGPEIDSHDFASFEDAEVWALEHHDILLPGTRGVNRPVASDEPGRRPAGPTPRPPQGQRGAAKEAPPSAGGAAPKRAAPPVATRPATE